MVKLVEIPVSVEDTVAALEKLLDDAKKKKIRGVAFIALGPKGYYYADATGSALSDPIRTRGTLFALAAKLEEIELRRSSE